MDDRSTRVTARASVLAGCLLALVALGYALCFGVLVVCQRLVPSPELWMTAAGPDDVFQLSIANLLYWMLALCLAIALAVVITLLAARTLRALSEVDAGPRSRDDEDVPQVE